MKKPVTVANRIPRTLDRRQLASILGGVGTYEKADKASSGPEDSYTSNSTIVTTTVTTVPRY